MTGAASPAGGAFVSWREWREDEFAYAELVQFFAAAAPLPAHAPPLLIVQSVRPFHTDNTTVSG